MVGQSSETVYHGVTGEEMTLARCTQGHVFTVPCSTRGCPVCDRPHKFMRDARALGLDVKAIPLR